MKLPPQALTHAEVQRLLVACGESPVGLRNRALLAILWRGLLRCEEAKELLPVDVDHDDGSILIREGKGRRTRTVGIDKQALQHLRAWEEVRNTLPLPAGAPLFCTFTRGSIGYPLGGSYVRAMVKRIGRRARIAKRCHPHGLRHTGAAEMMREKVPVLIIQEALGHSDLVTTQRYVKHLYPGEVIDAMKARHWPLSS